MLTSVQKEILQSLINLYRTSDGKSVKGEEIAELMNRNPGTIRNQMQSLRSLGLVKGVPGPRGGYKPTIKAYHTLNIQDTDKNSLVPIYKGEEPVRDISVAKIEFTSIPHPGECEAAIKAVGNIKTLDLGDKIRVGPTPVNKLVVDGIVVGRDDMDNIILLDTTGIRSIPNRRVMEVATPNLITLDGLTTIRDAARVLSTKKIEGAPVVDDGEVRGMVTLSDISRALAEAREGMKVVDIMTKNAITVDEDMVIADAIELMNKENIGRLIVVDKDGKAQGIVTRTDLLNKIAGLK
jgi:predicted transcriptional regulator